MWWETVGWLRPTGSVMSQMQASPSDAAAIIESSLTRVGSPSALNIRASVSAVWSLTRPPVTGEQLAASWAGWMGWMTGSVAGTGPLCPIH